MTTTYALKISVELQQLIYCLVGCQKMYQQQL